MMANDGVMAFHRSIDIQLTFELTEGTPVDVFWGTSQTNCYLLWHHRKIKRNQPRYQQENCGPPQVWFILGVEFPDGWRCHVHLFIQSYTSPAIIPLRKETSSESQRWMCFDVKCVYQAQNKSKTPCKDAEWIWSESVIIHSETSPVPTWTERPLSQEEVITPKAT